MLQRSNFHINKTIPAAITITPPSAGCPTASFGSGVTSGPRLSSIMPIPRLTPPNYTFGASEDTTFSSFLNSPIPDSSSLPSPQPMTNVQAPHYHRLQSLPSFGSPCQSSDDTSAFNPYTLFLSHSDTHQPRVGSPLRNSLSTDQTHSSSGAESPSLMNETYSTASTQSSSTFSQSTALSSIDWSLDDVPIQSTNMKTPRTTSSPAKVNASPPSSTDTNHDFRNQMPRPRTLPFQVRRPRSQRSSSTNALPGKADDEVKRRKTLACTKPLESSTVTRCTRMKSQQNALLMDAPSQTELPGTMRCQQGQWISAENPTVLVTGTDTLRDLREATDDLLDQYEADVSESNNKDQNAIARFYCEQLFAKRREFWRTRLSEIGIHGQC